jgi:protein O-GlcNAc transferase
MKQQKRANKVRNAHAPSPSGASRIPSQSTASRLGAAYALQQKGQVDLAEPIYKEILSTQPDNLDALQLLAMICGQRGDSELAVELLDRVLKLKPDSADAHNNRGNALKNLGRTADALASYDRALTIRPYHSNTLSNRGNALRDLGQHRSALDSYDRALAIQPDFVDAHVNRGNALCDLGRHDEALVCYANALSLKPNYVPAMANCGSALHTLCRYTDALEMFDRAIALAPSNASNYNNRGAVLTNLRRPNEALSSYARCLELRPDYPEALNNRGCVLRDLADPEAALMSYDQALVLRPTYVEALTNRGNALCDLGRLDEALEMHLSALKLRPNNAEALNNRGNVLRLLKRPEEALNSYEQAIDFKPNYAEAFNNRGTALRELRRLDAALASYTQAIRIKPDYAEAHSNLGNALKDLGRNDEALRCYDHALTIRPDYVDALVHRGGTLRDIKRYEAAVASFGRALELRTDYDYLYGDWLYTKMKICDWQDLPARFAALVTRTKAGECAVSPFPILAMVDSRVLQQQVATNWADKKHPIDAAMPRLMASSNHARIRVGYFSADFHNHATAYLMAELFERHDKTKFEVTAFSFGPDAGDEMRDRLVEAFDRFVDVRSRSDKEVALLARELEIDIAVDLKGYTQNYRAGIFAARAAPVQVNYLGFPGTMGAEYIDYLIADQILIPESFQNDYTEKIAYLPHSYQVNDAKRQIAQREFNRTELGLPPTGFVFCCFNNNFKILPRTFDCWMRILKQVDDSVLWLFEDNPIAASNLRKEAGQRGVDPLRLVFAKRMMLPEHLARHRLADLFLDTLPCNAHTTASDALWAGLPVLTCIGESFAARVAASLLNAIGLPELITTTPKDFEERAVTLATQPERLAAIKQKLIANRLTTPLFDTKLFAHNLEALYQKMFSRHQASLDPDHIDLVVK